MTGHKIRRYGDQAYCPVCGKTWDNASQPPQCVEKKTPQQWLDHMRKIVKDGKNV